MTLDPGLRVNQPQLAVAFIITGMAFLSLQDMLIKQLSGAYPLHQVIFARSIIAIIFSFALVKWEGGLSILKTDQPGQHLLRALLVVVANMSYFAALAVMPLAEATALFFVAPLFITLLSVPFLGESVGPRRLAAVIVGFAGVLLMLWPGLMENGAETATGVALLPILAALAYALMQILTRRLGVTAKASAMAVYIQTTFIFVGLVFWLAAGHGRYADGFESDSMKFLLRAWQWPEGDDIYLFAGCGLASAVIGYCLSQAYRIADAGVVAPFEYVALPLAVMWGWVIWEDLPDAGSTGGMLLIVGSGLFVFLREKQRGRPVSSKRPMRRW